MLFCICFSGLLYLLTGQSVDGLACVRFGLITEETDLEELIALVYTTGKEVEESSKVSFISIVIGSMIISA